MIKLEQSKKKIVNTTTCNVLKQIMNVYLLRSGAKATPPAVVAVRAVHAVCRLLTVNAAPVKIIIINVSTAPVVIIKAAVVTRIILPLIIIAFFPARTFKSTCIWKSIL